jgi:putative ABC transport system permease protein
MSLKTKWDRMMRWLPGGRERFRVEICEEIREHIDRITEENVTRGMSPEEARRDAQLRFGNMGAISDQCQHERQVFRFEEVLSDFRFGLRLLRRSPGFAFVAIVTLAFGIGANTAIFSLVHGVLLKQLPYPDADRLMTSRGFSIPDYEDFRQTTRAFDRTAIWASNLYTVIENGGAEQVPGITASPELFAMLGNPILGRTIRTEEVNDPLAIIGYEFWQSRYGGRNDVLGQKLNLNGMLHTIVGVMPRGVHYPTAQYKFWVTFGPSMVSARDQLQNRSLRIFKVVGHLREGFTAEQAQAEAQTFSQRMAIDHPESNQDIQFEFRPILETTVGSVRPALLILLGTVGFVLLIACANVANLLLARTASRRRELAVRVALGARRMRVVRQLLCENLLLAMIGGAVGVLLAWVGLRWLQTWQSAAIPRLDTVDINWTVLLFTFGLSASTGLLFGIVPAWHAANSDLHDAMKEGGRTVAGDSGGKMRPVLVMLEVALAVVVSVGAGLLVKSFVGLMNVDPGFSSARLLTGMAGLVDIKPEQRPQVVNAMLEQIERIPDVEVAGAGTGLPPETAQRGTQYEIVGMAKPEQLPYAYFLAVTPQYLPALQTRLLAGRFFGAQDTAEAPKVVIISEKLAHDRFGSRNPIGEQLKITNANQSGDPRTIVGVVADIRFSGLDDADTAAVYTPYPQNPQLLGGIYLMARTKSDSGALLDGVRRAAQAVSPGLYVVNIKPMTYVVEDTTSMPRLNTSLVAMFAILAVGLSATGVFGLIAYSVTQRQHEIGIRIALGARTADVVLLVMKQGMIVVAIGVLGGLAGAVASSRLLRTMLFEVEPTDTQTFAAVGLGLLTVALLASYLPVRRATKVDPMEALRCE